MEKERKQQETEEEMAEEILKNLFGYWFAVVENLPKNEKLLQLLRKSPLPHPTEENTSPPLSTRGKDEDIGK